MSFKISEHCVLCYLCKVQKMYSSWDWVWQNPSYFIKWTIGRASRRWCFRQYHRQFLSLYLFFLFCTLLSFVSYSGTTCLWFKEKDRSDLCQPHWLNDEIGDLQFAAERILRILWYLLLFTKLLFKKNPQAIWSSVVFWNSLEVDILENYYFFLGYNCYFF